MSKKSSTFRLSEKTLRSINDLKDHFGGSQAHQIEKAVKHYMTVMLTTEGRFMKLYDLLSENIQMLEIKRDYNPETMKEDLQGFHITNKESDLLEFYNGLWDKIRAMPFFSEKPTDNLLDD